MTPTRIAAAGLVATALLAGCGGGKKSSASLELSTTVPANLPTGVDTKAKITAAFERGYSECSTYSVSRLASKYKTLPIKPAVADGVGNGWARIFHGGPQTAKSARDGCRQAFGLS